MMTARPLLTKPADSYAGTADIAERRVLIALTGGPFAGGLAFATPPAFFPAIARELDVSVALLGQMITGMLLVGAAIGLVAGPLADRHGYRRLLVLGAIAAAVSLLGVGMAPTYPLLLVAGLCGGLATATLPGLSLAVAGTAFSGATRPRAVGLATAGSAAAGVLGIPLLTLLSGAAGWRVACLVAGMTAPCIAALLAAWLPIDTSHRVNVRHRTATIGAYRPLLGDRRMVVRYAALALRTVVWFGLLTYVGSLLSDGLGLSVRVVGVGAMLTLGGYVAGSLVASHLLRHMASRRVVVLANLAMGLAVLGVFSTLFGAVGTLVLLPIVGFASGLGWVGMATIMAAETPVGAGATMALTGAVTNLGAAGGGAVGGVVLATGGFDALAVCPPAVALLSAWLMVRDSSPQQLRNQDRSVIPNA